MTTRGRAEAPPLVETRGITKSFGGVQAVQDVSVAIAPGEVRGLVGENGAGKSTLAKLIGGVYRPDGGSLLVDGRPVSFHAPRDALDHGIATIAQEIALVPARTVIENVLLGIESSSVGVLRGRELRLRFQELNERTGFDLDGQAVVRTLRTADQQKVEILRAIARNARLVLMDEPTAALTRDETERLLEIVRRLAANGTAVVLVSHYLEEVLDVCDTVTVMRNGKLVRTTAVTGETPATLVAAMIGRDMSLEFPAKEPPPADAPVVLEARGLSRGRELQDVSLTVRAGEIVGLAGLLGSGRSEVARAIFGADRLDAGEVLFEGKHRSRSRARARRVAPGDRDAAREPQGAGPVHDASGAGEHVDHRRAGVLDSRRRQSPQGGPPHRRARPRPRRPHRLSGGDGQDALRGQPAEGHVRQVADAPPEAPDRRRAHPGRRRRRETPDPRADRATGQRGDGRAAHLLGDRGGAGPLPPRPRHARRPHGGRVRRRRGDRRSGHERSVRGRAGDARHERDARRSCGGSIYRDYGIVFAFGALFIAISLSSTSFIKGQNISNILDQWAAIGLLACGETICIIAGVFDLSVGSSVSVCGVVACMVANSTSPALGLLAGATCGLGLGLANGIVIDRTRINSFIGTLATSIIYSGFAIVITGGLIQTVLNPQLRAARAGLALPDHLSRLGLHRVRHRHRHSSSAGRSSAATSTPSAATSRQRVSPASVSV